MQKSSTVSLSIFVITMLVLVPVLQALPLSLPTLPNATAQPWYGATLNNTAHNSATATSVTISSFNVGTNANRLLVVAVEANNHSVSSVTFGGKALKQAAASFHNDDTEFWYVTNPNGTNTISVTMAGTTGVVAQAYAFYGVDEANPIPTTATNYTVSTPINQNPDISLNTEYSNSYVVDSASTYGGGTLTSPTCTSENSTRISGQVTGASSYKLQASATAVKCSWTNSAANAWDDAAIEIKAAGAAPPVTPITLTGKSTASGNVTAASKTVTLYNFNAGTSNNRLLLVGVAVDHTTVSSITFGGTSLTKAVSHFTNQDTEFWYLKNPSYTPSNIVVTMATATEPSAFVIGTYAFANVNQTSPIGNTTTNFDTCSPNCTSPSITIKTESPNDLVIDQPVIWGGITLSSPTCSQQWNSNVQQSSLHKTTGASSTEIVPVDSTVTCSWTASGSSDLWDDVAVELKAVSLQDSTGIMVPLYSYPTNGSSLSSYWQTLVNVHQSYPNVPLFAIINPNSGSCGSPCPNPDYKTGIGDLTNVGIVVLGYTFTSGGTRMFGSPTVTTSLENDTSNYTKWYQPKGLNGIMFDEFANSGGQEEYYSNATKYVHATNGLTYSFGNPGASTSSTYVNSGSADLLDIWEDSVILPPYSTLETNTFSKWTGSGSLGTTDLGFDKHNFSFLSWNITKANFPNNATLGNYSNFVSLFYITDNPGCGHTNPCTLNHANPWNTTSIYLTNMTKALNHQSSIITINSTDSSRIPMTGAYIQINQTNQTIPSGFTPYSFLGTQPIKYIFTPEKYSSTCDFQKWKDTGSTTRSRTMTVNSTSAVFTVVYSGTCP